MATDKVAESSFYITFSLVKIDTHGKKGDERFVRRRCLAALLYSTHTIAEAANVGKMADRVHQKEILVAPDADALPPSLLGVVGVAISTVLTQ